MPFRVDLCKGDTEAIWMWMYEKNRILGDKLWPGYWCIILSKSKRCPPPPATPMSKWAGNPHCSLVTQLLKSDWFLVKLVCRSQGRKHQVRVRDKGWLWQQLYPPSSFLSLSLAPSPSSPHFQMKYSITGVQPRILVWGISWSGLLKCFLGVSSMKKPLFSQDQDLTPVTQRPN